MSICIMHGIEKFHFLHQQKPVVQRLNVNFIRELLLICGWPREKCLCCRGVQAIHLISRLFWVRTLIFTLIILPPYLLGTIVLADCTLTVRESVPLYRHAWTKLVAKVVMRFAYRSGCCYSLVGKYLGIVFNPLSPNDVYRRHLDPMHL